MRGLPDLNNTSLEYDEWTLCGNWPKDNVFNDKERKGIEGFNWVFSEG